MSDRLVVRVLPDVPAIDKTFDYLLPDGLRDQVRVGDQVRVDLHGRRVGGWVVEVGVDPPPGVALRPLAKRSGLGPPPELIDLARWAAWRWAGRLTALLRAASPERVVTALPVPRPRRMAEPPIGPVLQAALADDRAVVRLPPAADLAAVAAVVAARGSTLVVCPTVATASAVADRLEARGLPVARHPKGWAAGAAGETVVGARSAVWAPVRDLAAIVVLDEHDEAHQQEQTPTWHARDVAIERARRAGVPCLLTSPCPSLEALAWGSLHTAASARERSGWPTVEVADRREEDPWRAGLVSPALSRELRGDRRVVCVLNRTGRAKLLACTACGELARCAHCDAAVEQPDDVLSCRRCTTSRPLVCLVCGGSRFRIVRAGVLRARQDLEALAGEPVAEVTGSAGDEVPRTRVVVGTEAVLHRVDRADVVAFLDLDQELLAPRYRAAEQALALLARAARLLGTSGPPQGPRAHGLLLLQTRMPDHEVVRAAVHADPSLVAEAEAARRALLRFPPETAMAEVSGPGADDFLAALGVPLGIERAEIAPGRWLLRAPDHRTLCDALAATPRPADRVRVAVDPLRV